MQGKIAPAARNVSINCFGDGNSMLFPGRPAGADYDDLYAVSVNTEVLTRLTESPGDDFDPTCGTH